MGPGSLPLALVARSRRASQSGAIARLRELRRLLRATGCDSLHFRLEFPLDGRDAFETCAYRAGAVGGPISEPSYSCNARRRPDTTTTSPCGPRRRPSRCVKSVGTCSASRNRRGDGRSGSSDRRDIIRRSRRVELASRPFIGC
jgi:hypothetical protein